MAGYKNLATLNSVLSIVRHLGTVNSVLSIVQCMSLGYSKQCIEHRHLSTVNTVSNRVRNLATVISVLVFEYSYRHWASKYSNVNSCK